MTTKKPPRHQLSKSTYMRGCQCVKSLWLHRHAPALRDEISEQQAGIFNSGTSVGELARDLFPGGVDASPTTAYEYQHSVMDTARYIAEGHTVIYEAAFQYNGILAALDILVKKGGKWYGYEVKSSTAVKPQFIDDVALQYFVIHGAGIQLEDIFLVHVNNEYVRNGSLELDALFHRVSLKSAILPKQEEVKKKSAALKQVLAGSEMPLVEPGKHCSKPYPCDFMGYCREEKEKEKESEGVERIDKKALQAFVKGLDYPLYFMDFETYTLAVPEYDGHWPYRQVPFQFSVHRQERKGGSLQHADFLAQPDCDPCPEFVEQLLEVLGTEGSIVVYNQSFENTRLIELKEDFPRYRERIEAIQARLVDLMIPFRKKHWSLPAMNGSYSIKAVLPALVPELSYDGLAICNGGDASAAFYNLKFEKDEAVVKQTREHLLKYCELDTMAMFRILEKIEAII